jgi:hypothetical protein
MADQPAIELPFGNAKDQKTATPPAVDHQGIASQVTFQLNAGFHQEVASAIHAAKNVVGLSDRAARILSSRTGWDITKANKHVQDMLSGAEQAEMRRSKRAAPEATTIPQRVARSVGGVLPQFAEYGAAYAVTRNPEAAYALVDASKEIDKGVGAAVKAGLIGGASGFAMRKISPLSIGKRIGAGAATGAASAALMGGSTDEILTSGIVGGAFASLPEKGKSAPKTLKERVDLVTKGPVEALDDFKKVFAPALRGPEAKEASLVIREHWAKLDQRTQVAYQRAHEAWRFFQDRDPAFNREFMKQMDVGGDVQKLPTEVQPFAKTVRSMLDEMRDELVKKGLLEHYYQDYFPHVWKDPHRAQSVLDSLRARKPMGGSGAYKRGRTFTTIEEGLKAGLEPISDNPLDMVFSKLREGNKAIAAHDVLQELSGNNLAGKFKVGGGPGKKAPSDWKALGRDPADKTFIVYGPPTRKISIGKGASRVTKNVKTGGVNIVGQWYAPEQVAKVIENHLAPGFQGGKVYDSVRSLGNVMNQWQLGFSAFHLGFTAIDSMISNTAAGLHYLTRGKPLKSASAILQTPLSPFRYYIRGSKVLREGLAPGTYSGNIADIADKVVMGGGRFARDEFYRTQISKQMREAFAKGDIGRGLMKMPFIPAEYISDVIMGHIVPRMKLGALSQLTEMELSTRPNMSRAELRESMARAVDSIDNRMGMIVYDNLFMNRGAKDLLMLSMRSVGWNLGTFREIVGGAADTRKLLQKNPELTYRLAYTAAMPMVVGSLGAMTQMMYGQGWPAELKDYFFPRTGRFTDEGDPERISFPSYIKDMFNAKTDPQGTIANKMHPMIQALWELWNNKDFYGDKIFNKDHDFMLDMAKFAAGEMVPFSARYIAEGQQNKGSGINPALPVIGVTPASRSVTQSPAARLASKFARERIPIGGRDQDAADKAKDIRDITGRLRQHDPEAIEDLKGAMNAGELGKSDIRGMSKTETGTGLVRTIQKLSLDEALDVWHEATPEERKQILPFVMKKVRGLKEMSPAKAQKLINRLRTEIMGDQQDKTAPPPAKFERPAMELPF